MDTVQASRALAEAHRAYRRGAYAEARVACEQLLAAMPGERPAKELLGTVLIALKEPAAAARLYEELLRQDPNNAGLLTNLGCARVDCSDLPAAIEAFRRARTVDPFDADACVNLGLAYLRTGELQQAQEMFGHARKLCPDDAVAAVYLIVAMLDQGRHADARAMLPQIDSVDALDGNTLNELGGACARLDEFGLAERYYQLALARDPALDLVRVNLAYVAERSNRPDAARHWLDAAGPGTAADPHRLLVSARLLSRDNRAAEALAELERALAGAAGSLRSEVLFEKGKLLDTTGRYDEAFAAWAEGNLLSREAAGSPEARARPSRPLSRHALDVDEPAPPAALAAGASPIFVVGFPRSGTTLLDRLLDAHPQLKVLEEKPALEAVVQALTKRRGFPQALSGLSTGDVDELRKVYWAEVRRSLPMLGVRTVVDKYPLNLLRLPVIARIFPGARIVLALRHPCDVVLSCFMQNFRFTDVTEGFWSLESTATVYDRVMTQWYGLREKYQPACLDVRYEDVVVDLPKRARQLVEFLGLPWDDAMLDYHSHAARSGPIHNPSYSQVIKPAYRSAKGRWQRYRKYLEPVLPVLEPHVVRLGYTLDD